MSKVKNGPGQRGENVVGKGIGEASVTQDWPGMSVTLRDQGPRGTESPLS